MSGAAGNSLVNLAVCAFERLHHGIVVLDGRGRVRENNEAAQRLLDHELQPDATCCALFGCHSTGPMADVCITEEALRQGHLPEVRLDLPAARPVRAAWVTASAMETAGERLVVMSLRPGVLADRRRRTDPEWLGAQRLLVTALGRTAVYYGEIDLGGDWLDQRPGQLLKLLVCMRHRTVPAEEIVETIWPHAEPRTVLPRIRGYVHALRDRLEPGRAKHSLTTSFVLARAGGYRLNLDRMDIDVDRFEECARQGLREYSRGNLEAAEPGLEEAGRLYRGDFLAEEAYADWAFSERERLRDVLTRVLKALVSMDISAGRTDAAIERMGRLASLHPYDSHVHRELIDFCIQHGRPSMAVRRYAALRARMLRQFDEDLDFTMADFRRAGSSSRS